MQLIEYFIWKNINNPYNNQVFSLGVAILLLFQPIASLMLLSNIQLKTNMILFYAILAIPYAIWKMSIALPYSTISPSGHLQWHFIQNNKYIGIIGAFIWVFFFLFSLFYNRKWYGFVFGIITLCMVIYNYYKDNSIESMWCWIANMVMIYYAAYLLLYLPFCEINKIC